MIIATPSIAVIGAGPAGLMAADQLARSGSNVTVYDRMPSFGRKFLLAGRGGLNLTHSEDMERFLDRYAAARPHLEQSIRAFGPDALRSWSEGLGQETFVGSSGRVFPRCFKTSPLLRAWLARLSDLGVRFAPRHRWTGFDDCGALTFETPDGERRVTPDATLLALGGASWPRMGSDGSWVPILSGLGVAVRPLLPSNAGFDIAWSEHFRERFAGSPLKRIALSFEGHGARGEAIVTREGLEGGAIYALSGPLRDAIIANGEARLTIDLRPDQDEAALVKRIEAQRKGLSSTNLLRKALALDPVATGLLREAHGVALPTQPEALARAVKSCTLTLHAMRPIERAISSAGGVSFEAIDERQMLKARPGIFVAGEMLDWEAPTGGYLLQASFATGFAAAQGVSEWLGRAREEAEGVNAGAGFPVVVLEEKSVSEPESGMANEQDHWDRVYATKDADAVSWFEASPERSLAMIEATGLPKSAAIIDIGGGLSRLPDALVAAGYSDVTILDISREAIERMTARFADNPAIHGMVGDLRNFRPERGYDLWHDRAVLHFMIDEEDRRRYHAALVSAVKPGGHVIIATFAPTGPEKCSGLPVRRYSPAELDAFLGPEFQHIEAFAFDHVTPGGAIQRFQAGRFRRR